VFRDLHKRPGTANDWQAGKKNEAVLLGSSGNRGLSWDGV
jgi:hypothetical protein